MNVGNWTWSRTMHVILYFECLPQMCIKMNGFEFDFSKSFLGGAHRAPSPEAQTPRFFSRAFPLVRASLQFSGAWRLRLGLCPLFAGALRPRFGPCPQLSTWFPHPPNKFMDPPVAQRLPLQNFCLRPCARWRGSETPICTCACLVVSISITRRQSIDASAWILLLRNNMPLVLWLAFVSGCV